MQSVRTTFGVADYSVSQTTLEQVFLSFASGEVQVRSGDVTGLLPGGYVVGDTVQVSRPHRAHARLRLVDFQH